MSLKSQLQVATAVARRRAARQRPAELAEIKDLLVRAMHEAATRHGRSDIWFETKNFGNITYAEARSLFPELHITVSNDLKPGTLSISWED